MLSLSLDIIIFSSLGIRLLLINSFKSYCLSFVIVILFLANLIPSLGGSFPVRFPPQIESFNSDFKYLFSFLNASLNFLLLLRFVVLIPFPFSFNTVSIKGLIALFKAV